MGMRRRTSIPGEYATAVIATAEDTRSMSPMKSPDKTIVQTSRNHLTSQENRHCLLHRESRGKPGGMTDKNDPDWVPTLNMGPRNTIKPSVIVHQQQGSNPEAKVLHRRLGNKTGKPPITLQKKVNRYKNYTHSKSRQKEEVSEKTLENAVVDSKMFRCFLCDKHMLVEGASSLSTLTDATKVPFQRKLDSMVADLVMGVTSNKDGLLCSSCARVLNHVDCLEDELSRLNKVLLNTLLRKYDLEHVIECTGAALRRCERCDCTGRHHRGGSLKMQRQIVCAKNKTQAESPNNFIEEVHFTLEQNRTEIHAAEKLIDGSILDLKNATSYLTQVRKTVGKHSHLYSNYLAILKKFKSHSIDTCDVMEKVTDLFKGHPNLIVGFMRFLPSEYIVDVLCNEQVNASPPLVNEDSLPDASEVSFKLDDYSQYDENENDHHDYSLSTSFLTQMDEDDISDDSTVCESLSVQSSATKRRAVSGHIYNKSSDQPVKNNKCSNFNDNFAVPLQNNADSEVVNGVVSPFNHIKNKCESIPSDNLMVPAIRQSKKSVISSIAKRVTPTIVRVQENADILFGNHLVSVVRPRRKKSRFSQAIESIETEASEPMLDKVVPGDATSDDCTENSVEAVLQNTNNCIKTLRSELVPTKRQQYYRAKSVVSMSYLDEVKFTFGSESQTYDDFLDIVYKFHTQSMNTPDFIDKLINLFKDHPKLIIEFNKYLPPSYKIEVLGFKPETLSDSIIPRLKHRVSSELKEDCQIRVITNPQPS
uniref:Uncharacterized protein n=1 Tax=Timema bartmani TaxID=61472 RepID=A0A7R9EWJ4_9NEOP|nr:unnamed protein product [Timema bartmani]